MSFIARVVATKALRQKLHEGYLCEPLRVSAPVAIPLAMKLSVASASADSPIQLHMQGNDRDKYTS